MEDNYGRPVKNIRISLLDECNLNCYYCHHEGQSASKITMTPEEIEKIIMIAEKLDIKKIKFTGGEPLIRNDIIDIIARASKYMDDVSMTTNGTLLAPLADELYNAGLTRINVSLDTLDKKRYKEISGTDKVDRVLAGIRTAVTAGLNPVKVNIVAFSDTGHDDLMRTVDEVWNLNAIPQIIELVDLNGVSSSDISHVEDFISSKAIKVRERNMHRRKIYTLETSNGELKEVEIVRPMHNTVFCANCSRIRVTNDGLLKPCLMHNNGLVDILTPLRRGASSEELIALFQKTVKNRVPYWR